MEHKLKQRLVGATVVTALAVIFVPMLFEDVGEEQPGFELAIPEQPADFESKVLPLPDYPANSPEPERGRVSRPASPPIGQSQVAPSETEAPSTQQPGLSAWVIQVGSFSQEENALALRDNLRNGGFSAFVEPVKGDKGFFYRVFVGPELDRERAEAAGKKLEQMFGVRAMVIAYSGR